ncbi:MAG: hypothetical protein IE885_05440 [Campylobacterales bacterium]|nr:hypothetical protein [Campylobacterales bacterium]
MVESNFVKNFRRFEALVRPSYLLESPYKEILIAAARGDGKYYSVLRKARLSETVGEQVIEALIDLNILRVEYSRETPLKSYPKQKIKKELRSYRIQDKLRFVQPFMRFWFGFVAFYADELRAGKSERFLKNFIEHYERLRSLIYEQLCDALLVEHFSSQNPLKSSGSYWTQQNEFDILAVTDDKKVILGECKYKDRKVCKNELTKLKVKAVQSGLNVDTYALFSKDGFSNELLQTKDEGLLLFDLNDLKSLL